MLDKKGIVKVAKIGFLILFLVIAIFLILEMQTSHGEKVLNPAVKSIDGSWTKGDTSLNLNYKLITEGEDVCGRHYTPTCIFNKDTVEQNMVISQLREWQELVSQYENVCSNTTLCSIIPANASNKTLEYTECLYPSNCSNVFIGSVLEDKCEWVSLDKLTSKDVGKDSIKYYDISSGNCHLVWRQYFSGKDAPSKLQISKDNLKTQFNFTSDKSVDVVPSMTITDSKSNVKTFEMPEMAWWNINYAYKRIITFNTTVSTSINIPFRLNSSNGINGNEIWAFPQENFSKSTNYSMYWYYNNFSDGGALVNFLEDTQRPHDAGNGTERDNNSQQNWYANYVPLYWNLNSTGNSANTTATITWHGTITYVPAKFGYGVKQNGNTANFGSVPNTPQIAGDSTFCIWANFSSLTLPATTQILFTNIQPGGVAGMDLETTGGDKFQFVTRTSDSGAAVATGTKVLIANQWYLACGIVSGTNVSLYVNGTIEKSVTSSEILASSVGGIYIGDRVQQDYPMNGTYDNIMYWNITLLGDEIKAMYDEGMLRHSELGAEEPRPNTAPNQTQPILNATSKYNSTSDNLTCYNQSTSDVDGDKVTNIYNWFKNSQSLAVLNMPFDTNLTNASITNSIRDYSGYKNNGTGGAGIDSKTPKWTASGKIGGAYEFDGIDDYVDIPSSASMSSWTAGTIEMWLYLNSTPTTYVAAYADIRQSDTYRIHIAFYSTTKPRIALISEGLTNIVAESPEALSLNTWYHVVGTFDASTDETKIWVNGVVQKTTTTAFTNLVTTAHDYINIGGRKGTSSFDGNIDEVRIYNYALTPQQIAAHYNQEYNKIVAEETNAGDSYICSVTPNDGGEDGTTLNSTSLLVMPPVYNITFNVTDSLTGDLLPSTIDNITCNNSFSVTNQPNPAGPYIFYGGSYECIFVKFGRYDKTISFTADNEKTVVVPMSEKRQLTVEEHNWLEAIYKCLYEGDCKALNLLENINQTTTKIWDQFKRTDQSVVTFENVTSRIVSNASNFSIDYSVKVPFKEGYSYNDFLPIRIAYWFLDSSNTTCFSQGEKPVGVETPYCYPLIAETVGQINKNTNFTVELRPSLPVGNYTIVRDIEIDPQQTWIKYGQEIIGTLAVTDTNEHTIISLATQKPSTQEEPKTTDITGNTVKEFLTDKNNLVFVWLGLITLLITYQIFFNKRRG